MRSRAIAKANLNGTLSLYMDPLAPTPSSVNSLPVSSGKSIWKVIALVLGALLVLGLIFGLYVWHAGFVSPKQVVDTSSPTKSPVAVSAKTPVLIYETDLYADVPGHDFQSATLSRKVGSAAPEVLATFAQKLASSGITTYVLSPDKNHVAINLDKKISIIDLTTKKVQDVPFTPRLGVFGFSYSPDGTQLLISDFSWSATSSANYYLHQFNLTTGKDVVLQTLPNYPLYSPGPWRSDNKVVLFSEPAKEGGSEELFYLDLTTNTIHQTPGDGPAAYDSDGGAARPTTPVVLVSSDGQVAAEPEGGRLQDICTANTSDYVPAGNSHYKLIDTVTGSLVGEIKSATSYIDDLNFSSNHQEVLYRTEMPWANTADCSKPVVTAYVSQNIATGEMTPIADLQSVFASLDIHNVQASVVDATTSTSESLLIGKLVVATIPNPYWRPAFHIALQYWQ